MSTSAIAIAIIALIIGVVVGIGAYPSIFPSAGVSLTQTEYDGLLNDRSELQALKATQLTGEVTLGFLGSLTGRLATFGENELTAAQFAASQVNDHLEDAGMNWTIKIVAEDTQTTPSICLEKVELFNSQGITLLIGPLSSAEVLEIKGYCDSNKVLAISQSSTVPSLSIPDDYIYRFAPTDVVQGRAIARMIWDDNITHVIAVTAQDAWGEELRDTTKARYIELGGTWWTEQIDYSVEAAEFSTEANTLATEVQNAITAHGNESVGVLMIGFEEVAQFFTDATAYPVLSTVNWYGSDGTALSGALLASATAADFAISVGYPNTIYKPSEEATSKFEAVRANNIDVLGREPDPYSYACYDIVWAYALALMAVDTYDADAVKEVMPTVAKSMLGALGWINLDEAGDLEKKDYNIWVIEETAPDVYGWKLHGVYNRDDDSITLQ
jgi:branched-chain amino acid transport system substrate-binding protein